MAAPAWVASTSQVAELDSSISLTLPATIDANDIIIIRSGYRGPNTVTLNTPTHATLTFAPVMAQSGGAITQQRAFWARAAGGEGGTVATVTKLSGTLTFFVQADRYSGCITTGNPYDETAGAQQETQSIRLPSPSRR